MNVKIYETNFLLTSVKYRMYTDEKREFELKADVPNELQLLEQFLVCPMMTVQSIVLILSIIGWINYACSAWTGSSQHEHFSECKFEIIFISECVLYFNVLMRYINI